MLIGVALVIILLIQIIVLIFTYRQNPFSSSFMPNNPLKIIAYGLFFSTGVDLAYMLFTPGPDEAIDPVMTGLAAAILLGVGNISDYSQLQLKHGVILFLAVAALAGLFATKKYLYIHKKEKTNGKNDASSATQEDKAKA